MPRQEEERMGKQARKHDTLQERLQKTRNEIIETFKARMGTEKEFLETIKKQREYWKGQLKNTDPGKNKERYNELKEKIKSEEKLIKQIEEELDNINEEIKQEKEHKEKEYKY